MKMFIFWVHYHFKKLLCYVLCLILLDVEIMYVCVCLQRGFSGQCVGTLVLLLF